MCEVFQLTVKYRGVYHVINYFPRDMFVTDEEKKEAIIFWNSNNVDETGYINTIKRRLHKICIFENHDYEEMHPVLEKVLREETPMICDKCLLNANFNMSIDSDNSDVQFKKSFTSVNTPITCFREKKVCNCLLVQIFNKSSICEHAGGVNGSKNNSYSFPYPKSLNLFRFIPSFTDADFRVIDSQVIPVRYRTFDMVELSGKYELDESNFEIEINPGEDYHPQTVNQSIQLERESARLDTNQIFYLRREIETMKGRLADFDRISRYFYHNVAEQIVGHYFKKNQSAIINEGFAEIIDMITSR